MLLFRSDLQAKTQLQLQWKMLRQCSASANINSYLVPFSEVTTQWLNQNLPFHWQPVQTYGGLQENLLSVNFFLSFFLPQPPCCLLLIFPTPCGIPCPVLLLGLSCSEKIIQLLVSVSSLTGSTGITGSQGYTWSPWTTCTYELFYICSFLKENGSALKVIHVYIVCCRALQVLMDLQAQKETWWVSWKLRKWILRILSTFSRPCHYAILSI